MGMILFTDIGKDIDDAVALTYAIIVGIPLKTIITTNKDAVASANICRNIIDNLSDKYPKAKDIKIYAGSTKPIKKGIEHANIYHGPFSKSHIVPVKLDSVDEEIPKGDALLIGPTTDLARMLEQKKINRVIYMGQAKKDHTRLLPDLDSYNLRCDPFASEICFQFQDKIPFGFIGKDLAYKVPFTKTEFEKIGDIDHPVAKFLKEHAFTSYDYFKDNNTELFNRVYKGTDSLSYCYDPLTMLAVKHPNLFTFEKFGKHRIGVGIEADEAKSEILDTIYKGLSK